jgi:hypothetical protein
MRTLVAAAAVLLLSAGAVAATFPGSSLSDRIASWGNGTRDSVRCGAGRDVVNADLRDVVASDCETVLRVVSADRTGRAGAQHGTVAEPDSFAWGSTIVAVAQSGRYPSGGASAILWATSLDAGRSWRAGLLPGLDGFQRVSDPVIAYDPVRRVWLAAALGISSNESGLLISRSADGVVWEPPVVADALPGSLAFDKEWISCDTWAASPHRGRCYLAYTDLRRSGLAVRSSVDGGRTWSAAVTTETGEPAEVGAFPVVRPSGDLVVLYAVEQRAIAAVRSTDGGATFGPKSVVAELRTRRPLGIRAVAIPSADVAADGRVLVAWQDCRARGQCDANDLAVASSPDGVTWTAPIVVSTAAVGSAFAPALAVDPASGRVGVVTYAASQCAESCRVDAWMLESSDGRTFGPARRLSARSIQTGWVARAPGGAMLADYQSLSYARGRAIPLVVLALSPRGDVLRQVLFAPMRIG